MYVWILTPCRLQDLRLRDEDREMIFKGPLKKKGGTQSENAELQVFLFDHAVLMVKQKAKNEQYKVYRKVCSPQLSCFPLDLVPKLIRLCAANTPGTSRRRTSRRCSLCPSRNFSPAALPHVPRLYHQISRAASSWRRQE